MIHFHVARTLARNKLTAVENIGISKLVFQIIGRSGTYPACSLLTNNNNNNNDKSRSKPWALWTRQLANSANLGRKICSTSGDEREGAFLFCREFRCWCSATTLYCYMTPCQPLTALTDDQSILYNVNFLSSSGTYLPRVKRLKK